MTIPTTHKAVVANNGNSEIKEVPVPTIDSDEVLVKTVSLSINPTDWKHIKLKAAGEGSVSGCDFSGDVVAVGKDVTQVRVGDSGYGLVPGSSTESPENGAFAEYVRIKAKHFFVNHLVKANETVIPIGPIKSYEAGAFLPIPIVTVAMTFRAFGFSIFDEPSPATKNKILFIWGGATALGYLGIQLGRRLGFKVIAVASKKHEKVLTGLGASKLFDYHDADIVDQIKAYAGDDIEYVADFVTEDDTTEKILSVVSKTKPVNIACVSIYKEDKAPENVKFHGILAYLAVSAEKKFGNHLLKSTPDLLEWGEKFPKQFSETIAKDPSFVLAEPLHVLPGGLSDVAEGLAIVEQGKNSGYKVIINM